MERREQYRIARERDGFLHVFLVIPARELAEADVLEQAIAEARTMAPPVARDDRHAHVERIARRAAARVRIRIEQQVDILIAREILRRDVLELELPGPEADVQQAAARHAHRIDLLRAVLDEDMAPRHGAHDAQPEAQHVIRELPEIVEAPKDDGAVHMVFMRCPEHARRGRIAEMRVRHPQDGLREVLLVEARRIAVRVAEEIVDGLRPRGRHVADARDLHRRGPVAHDNHRAAAAAVHFEIEQDVDFVIPDVLRDIPIIHVARVHAQLLHLALHLVRIEVARLAELVHIDLERAAVVRHQELRREDAQHVVRERARDIADAELCVTVALQRVRERLRVLRELVIEHLELPPLVIAEIVEIMQEEQVVAVLDLLDDARCAARMRNRLPCVGAALLLVKELVPDEAVALPDAPHVVGRKRLPPHDVVEALERFARRCLDEVCSRDEAVINLSECHGHANLSPLSIPFPFRQA